MESNNSKKLGIIFLVVIITIIVVFIVSFKSLLSVNNHEYEKITTTNKVEDKSYVLLSDKDKEKFEDILNDNIYLTALNNALSGRLNYYGVNLIESENSKYVFSYTYSKLESDEDILIDKINAVSEKFFNTTILEENIKNYFNGNNYVYTINHELEFCLKPLMIKTEKNNFTLKVNMVKYDENICMGDEYLDEDILSVGYLNYHKQGEYEYLNTVILEKGEN